MDILKSVQDYYNCKMIFKNLGEVPANCPRDEDGVYADHENIGRRCVVDLIPLEHQQSPAKNHRAS